MHPTAELLSARAHRNFKGSASYVKSFLRKGQALLGLGCSREAAATLEAGVKLDPFNLPLKQALQLANQAMLKVGRQTRLAGWQWWWLAGWLAGSDGSGDRGCC